MLLDIHDPIVCEQLHRVIEDIKNWNHIPVKPVQQRTEEYYDGKLCGLGIFELTYQELLDALCQAKEMSDCSLCFPNDGEAFAVVARRREGARKSYRTIYVLRNAQLEV